VRLGKGVRQGSWAVWAAVLFALLTLGMAVPIDVLGLDDSYHSGQSADTPLIAEVVQVQAIRPSEESVLSGLFGAPLPSSGSPTVLKARQTLPEPTARSFPLLCSRIFPRAQLAREASQASASTIDPIWGWHQPCLMSHGGSSLLHSVVDEISDGLCLFHPSGLTF
jgi:hypothetical protein